MIEQHYRNVLRKIYARLCDHQINWVVTGSLGMALQGMCLEVHDIDIQTDQRGAYAIESCFSEYVVRAVQYSATHRIRSHFGALEIDGVKVEIMGDIQKLLEDQKWEDPVPIEQYKHWVQYEGMQVPVLDRKSVV